jgi:hypothetical protein
MGKSYYFGGNNGAYTNGDFISIYEYNNSSPYIAEKRSTVTNSGIIESLHVKLDEAPGSGTSKTFTLYKNGSATDLSCTISDSATSSSDSAHSVLVSAGDTLALLLEKTGATLDSKVKFLLVQESETQTLITSHNYAPSTSTTTYMDLHSGSDSASSTEVVAIIPTAGTFTDMYVDLRGRTLGTNKSYTFTLYKNGSATDLSCTITGSQLTGNDTTHSVLFSKGDTAFIAISPTNTPSSLTNGYSISIGFTPSVSGESIYMGRSINSLSNSGIQYNEGFTFLYQGDADESDNGNYSGDLIVKRFMVQLTTAPGTSKSRTFRIRKNGVDTDTYVSITGTNTDAEIDSPGTVFTLGDIATMSISSSSTPASSKCRTAVVLVDSTSHIGITKDLEYSINRKIGITKSLNYDIQPKNASGYRLLEDSDRRLLEDGGTRLLEYFVFSGIILKDLEYRIRNELGIQKGLAYEVMATTTETIQKDLDYFIKTGTSTQKDLDYAVLTSNSVVKDLDYTVITTDSTNKDLDYTVITEGLIQKGILYEVVVTGVEKIQAALDYTILTSVSAQKDLDYFIVTEGIIQKGLAYAVLPSTTITKDSTYTVQSQNDNTKDLDYRVVIPDLIQKDLAYFTRVTTDTQKDLSYSILTSNDNTKTLEYRVINENDTQKDLDYYISITTNTEKDLGYNLQVSTTIQKGITYSIDVPSIIIQKDLDYVVITTSSITNDLDYNIVLQDTIQKDLDYSIRGNLAVTKGIEYTIISPQSIEQDLQYTVTITPSALEKALEYIIVQRTTKQYELRYRVDAPHSISKELLYTIGEKIGIWIKHPGERSDSFTKEGGVSSVYTKEESVTASSYTKQESVSPSTYTKTEKTSSSWTKI